jgi:hypothetical protein
VSVTRLLGIRAIAALHAVLRAHAGAADVVRAAACGVGAIAEAEHHSRLRMAWF